MSLKDDYEEVLHQFMFWTLKSVLNLLHGFILKQWDEMTDFKEVVADENEDDNEPTTFVFKFRRGKKWYPAAFHLTFDNPLKALELGSPHDEVFELRYDRGLFHYIAEDDGQQYRVFGVRKGPKYKTVFNLQFLKDLEDAYFVETDDGKFRAVIRDEEQAKYDSVGDWIFDAKGFILDEQMTYEAERDGHKFVVHNKKEIEVTTEEQIMK
jgi:hypothetical protein